MMLTPPRYRIDPIAEDLYLIRLFPPISGFDNFIGVWLYRKRQTLLVDVGPSICADPLKQALQELSVSHLDLILLTHIHIDHAGGCGHMATAFPDTPIVCHPKGIPHLADPERLQQGTLKTLGTIGRQYGPFHPVSTAQMTAADTFVLEDINPIATPGHAPHHFSYAIGKYLFAGEAAGVHLSLPSGKTYLRPATPPVFFLETALQSIDTLIDLNPPNICYGHLGFAQDAVPHIRSHRDQLLLWHTLIREEIERSSDDSFYTNCIERLIAEDPRLSTFNELSAPARRREYNFIQNSIKGFEGYLKNTVL